ncbi:50S ribosomal protein L3 [Clostridia bacterium]|nr:50S ribosomal protein L3 [Clostridia bacterium]
MQKASKGLIGRKIGMTQVFDEKGLVVPVTVVEITPNAVTQVKTTEGKDGYSAVQLGAVDAKPKHLGKPLAGHFRKNDLPFKRYLKEFRLNDGDVPEYAVGDIIKVADVFTEGDVVDVTGTSKGKGFQGAIKRHNQHRLKETHGTGPVVRQAGSMGACSTPSRIFKGKNMAGHMGHETVTVQNLVVVKIFPDENLIAIRGAVPGPKKSIVKIRHAVKAVGKSDK